MGNPERHEIAVARSARDDTVKVIGEHLRFLQTLASTGGATVPVGPALRLAVEGFDQCFGFDSHLVFGAPGEVCKFFGVAEDEGSARIGMTGIRRNRGVAELERLAESSVADVSGPASVADSLKLVVPARCGE